MTNLQKNIKPQLNTIKKRRSQLAICYDYSHMSNNNYQLKQATDELNLKQNILNFIFLNQAVKKTILALILLTSSFLIAACGGGGGGGPAAPTTPPDTTAPSNYSLSSSITAIDSSNENNFLFTINTVAENINTVFNYSIEDNLGSTITGSGTLSTSTQTINNIDISGLNAGTVVVTATLTDAAGNIGVDATLTLNKTTTSSNVILSGAITFDFVPHNTTTSGLDYLSTTSKPARGIEVQLLDASNATLATTLTNSSGDYQFSVAANTQVRVRAMATLKSPASPVNPSWDFSVTDNTNSNALYAMQGSLISTGVSNSTRDLHAPSGWDGISYSQPRTAGPFAILNTVYESIQLIVNVDATVNLPPAEIRWSINNNPADGLKEDGDIGTSYYSPSEGNIYLLGAADNDTEEYDQHVIAHEWCHYLVDNLSRDESVGGSHSTQDKLDPRVALSEGLCNAVSGMSTNDPIYRDSGGTSQASGFSINIETNNISNKGWYSEATAASILYDIFDSTNDGIDTVNLGFNPIYDVLTSTAYKTADAFSSLHLFFSELKNKLTISNPSVLTDINDLINFHNFIVNNALGTSETNDAGVASILPLYHTVTVGGAAETICSINDFGTRNKIGNTKFAIFTASSTTNYSISVTRGSGDSNSDPDFILWRNSTPIAISESSTVDTETWNGLLTSDTYLLEIYDFDNTSSDTGLDVCFDVQIN